MMKVECSWCGVDLGWRSGPDGQVTHGICKPCQEQAMQDIKRPFSVGQKTVAAVLFSGWLLLSGWAGECDRQDALAYEQTRAEMMATASTWAVTR